MIFPACGAYKHGCPPHPTQAKSVASMIRLLLIQIEAPYTMVNFVLNQAHHTYNLHTCLRTSSATLKACSTGVSAGMIFNSWSLFTTINVSTACSSSAIACSVHQEEGRTMNMTAQPKEGGAYARNLKFEVVCCGSLGVPTP